MDENAFIHDVYVNVNWPIVVFVATALLFFLVAVLLWSRRR